MTELCLMVAEQSLRLSGIILFLWILRALLRKIPGSALYLLWILVFTGLLVPFRVEIPYHAEAPAVIAETPHATDAPGDHIEAGTPAAAKPADTAGTPAAEKPASARRPADRPRRLRDRPGGGPSGDGLPAP